MNSGVSFHEQEVGRCLLVVANAIYTLLQGIVSSVLDLLDINAAERTLSWCGRPVPLALVGTLLASSPLGALGGAMVEVTEVFDDGSEEQLSQQMELTELDVDTPPDVHLSEPAPTVPTKPQPMVKLLPCKPIASPPANLMLWVDGCLTPALRRPLFIDLNGSQALPGGPARAGPTPAFSMSGTGGPIDDELRRTRSDHSMGELHPIYSPTAEVDSPTEGHSSPTDCRRGPQAQSSGELSPPIIASKPLGLSAKRTRPASACASWGDHTATGSLCAVCTCGALRARSAMGREGASGGGGGGGGGDGCGAEGGGGGAGGDDASGGAWGSDIDCDGGESAVGAADSGLLTCTCGAARRARSSGGGGGGGGGGGSGGGGGVLGLSEVLSDWQLESPPKRPTLSNHAYAASPCPARPTAARPLAAHTSAPFGMTPPTSAPIARRLASGWCSSTGDAPSSTTTPAAGMAAVVAGPAAGVAPGATAAAAAVAAGPAAALRGAPLSVNVSASHTAGAPGAVACAGAGASAASADGSESAPPAPPPSPVIGPRPTPREVFGAVKRKQCEEPPSLLRVEDELDALRIGIETRPSKLVRCAR